MKTFLRILKFANPIWKYAIPYAILIVIHSLFNMMNFALIIPVLTTLFNGELMQELVTTMPEFRLNTDVFQEYIRYYIYRQFGAGYSINDVLLFISQLVVSSVFISNIARYGAQKIMENLRIHTLQNLRDTLFTRVMNLNVRFFNSERKGDILSKLTSDINMVQFCVTSTLQVVFKEPALIIGYFIALIAISGKLTMFTVLILPITALIIGTIVKKLRKSARQGQEALGDMISTAEEALSGVKVIKAYGATDYIVNKFKGQDSRYANIMRGMATRQQMASPMSEFLGVSAVAIILIYGGGLVISGELDAGGFIAYIGMFSQITRPARAITDGFSTIHQGLAAADRVLELIDQEPEVLDKGAKLELDFKDRIEFKDVRFRYNDTTEVIKGINFTINKGETVALVGSSGGGKSTIADLIPRFYDITSGEILIDGVDIKEYKLDSLRGVMGIVSQDVVLFNDSIENNITLGNKEASREMVMEAAKVANAHTFIEATERGYETNIGDRGAKLSGGQRQRLSIARAVLKNPQILILDEATSALDTESEKQVQDALTALLKDRTSLVIAHRLSTIQHSDKIIVISDGVIAEQGTHSELLENGTIYKNLIDMQKLS